MGVSGLDFADAGTGTCTTNGTSHSYVSGNTCTVNVTFSPSAPGARYGAVVIKNNSGDVLAQGYISGSGLGPLVNFPPGTQSVIADSSAPWNLGSPDHIAVDGAGNIYLADGLNARVVKETLSGGAYTQSTVGTGLTQPSGVAVDGAGNVYIADTGLIDQR
jgi:hypothetical protein